MLTPPPITTPQLGFRSFAAEIERKILIGEIKPGDVLPSEAKMAEQFGVNRSTIREAIRLLEQNGFVGRETGKKKLFAKVPQSDDISQRLIVAMAMNQVTFEELWEVMYALEPAAAQGASGRRTDDDLVALERNLAASREALADLEQLTRLDIEFHLLVARAAANRALEAARLPISELFYPAFLSVMSRLNAAERLLFAHVQITDAIRVGDAATARAWMEKHISDFRRGYELANLSMESPAKLHEPSLK